jgi:beta-fructofuranosidase
MGIFFCPTDGFVGDVIPFYWQGTYHAFYLKAPLPPKRDSSFYTSYAHVVSQDLVHWEEWPTVIVQGPEGSYDNVSCWTGSVIERNGQFYLFYTGFPGREKPQTVCLATSQDLRTWEKSDSNPILPADPRWYEQIDWRDPFPFWNEETGEYWMLLAARQLTGPNNRRGVVALAVSKDLGSWEVREPFWAPNLYYTHECPDLFRWNKQWVLVYSTFSERQVTHYRLSDSLAGPWLAPANDTFDGRGFYAAKTASDGKRRFVFGWLPTREQESDEGKWQWGGNMVVHEIVDAPMGQGLAVRMQPEMDSLFAVSGSGTVVPKFGEWQSEEGIATAAFTDGFAACLLGEMPDASRIDLTINCEAGTRGCGVLLRTDNKLESYYQVRWEPGARRIVFDRWPRPGDVPFILERPLDIDMATPLRLQILVEGTAIVIYANDTVALSTRGYEHRTGAVGLFVSEGGATFRDITMYTAK